ncbi:glutamate 5-kinase [SAR202 cluster bacterium AC-647-N09_OGT_505m]|nr:glutamate 5-kinase [SAR202 cluster bacterium AC-647-N09_OGT_505m]
MAGEQQETGLYRRIVVKAGTNVLTGGGANLDFELMASLVEQVAGLRHRDIEVLLVTSGAIAAGRHVLDVGRQREDIPSRQALAAVGQSRLMHTYAQLFDEHNITVAQGLLSRGDIMDREGYLNVRNTLLALLEWRVIPIINENDVVAVEEIGVDVFGDNDNLSAMVANLVDADLLIMLSDIDGLYTSDPHEDSKAVLIPMVGRVDQDIEALAGANHSPRSRGGMQAKLDAIKLATAFGVAVALVNGREGQVVTRLAAGESVGTFFAPTGSKVESRKRWMLSGLSTRGRIVVDAGAAEALRTYHRSLLPAGVDDVDGDFLRGDIILVVGPNGQQVACGIASYGASDVAAIKGLRSDRIEEALGHRYGEEVVHRNNMVLL